MKIKTQMWCKVQLWQLITVSVDVESEEQYKKMVNNGTLISDCNDMDYIDTEFFFDTMTDTGEYEYTDEYEVINED